MAKFNLRKTLLISSLTILFIVVFCVVFKPLILNCFINNYTKYARGRFVCALDNEGNHVGKLYKLSDGKKTLIKTSVSNSCIFSRPKINAGFFVLAVGGGGGATPYENGNSGQIISKYKRIDDPVIVIKVGKGGNGTYVSESNKFIDAQDGTLTEIKDLKLFAKGGSRSTRMTPLGNSYVKKDIDIPEKYIYLYDIPKNAKYGRGGRDSTVKNSRTAKAPGGHSGIVVIQW